MFQKLSLTIRKILGKIIIKALFIPGIREWFDKVVQLYEKAEIDDECDMLKRGGGNARLNFSHYLPDTEERIERLRRVINKRPVAIILHGPSVKELEARITELADCDICYFGLNVFHSIEEHILQKVGRPLSVIMQGTIIRELDTNMTTIIDVLERQEDNVFIADKSAFRPSETFEGLNLSEFVKKYDEKLLFYNSIATTSIRINNGLFLQVPSLEYPLHFPRINSAVVLLSLALIGGAAMVVVFGGDGGRISEQELYYRETGWGNSNWSVAEQSLALDTKLFNATMPLILEKIYKMYNLKPVDIINCSPQSHYTALPKLSYDETFATLKSFKRVTA